MPRTETQNSAERQRCGSGTLPDRDRLSRYSLIRGGVEPRSRYPDRAFITLIRNSLTA